MQFISNIVGKKILVAISGQMMVLFVIAHLLGNSSIFIPGGINAYAEHIHAFPPLVWGVRLVMATMVLTHIIFGIKVTLENRRANPISYAVNKKLKATFASRNMIWTGVLLLVFIIYHLLHFTIRVMPDVASRLSTLAVGDTFDVYSMVVGSFHNGAIAGIYVVSMIFLFLHMYHGIQAFFQTMGWNNDCTLPLISRIGRVIAIIFLVGYSSIPIFILTHFLS